ncbi:MAG: N-acetyltransferase [Acidimicrobiia bacterium]|nr:N-acetyltransferase [Acidimicrobiia bacterium]
MDDHDDARWVIRREVADDHAAVAAVVEAAFGSPAEARLVDAIRASSEYIAELALVAELDGRVVGHVMISRATLVDGEHERRIVMLSPLAVSPEQHGRGIGSALVREVTTRADGCGEPLVVLEGDPGFYGRLGFEHALARGIEITLPSWAPPEAAQVMRLSSYDPAWRGHVVYPPTFDEFAEH